MEPVWTNVSVRYCFVMWASVENCDAEPEWRTVLGKYCFVICSQCGEELQEGFVLLCGASVENCFRRVLFCDAVPVWATVAGKYSFVMWSQCGELF